jgi:tRNA threonylcarbamoyladenosine biosynthesis protein TsaB
MADWTVAIETVATAGSIAILRDDALHAELNLPADSRSAKTLAAGVQQLWQQAGKPAIELVAVAKGPGSFTGLRVGVTTAKALAYGWRAKLVGVNTLDAIAAQVPQPPPPQSLHVVLDAQRQELFVARFQALASSDWHRLGEDQIISTTNWLANLQPGEIVTGPALKKLREKLPAAVTVVPDVQWHPRAATIAQLGRQLHQNGHPNELWTLLPHYLRESYAEEKRPEVGSQRSEIRGPKSEVKDSDL